MNELRKLPLLAAYVLLLITVAVEAFSVAPQLSETLDGAKAAIHASKSKPPPQDLKTDNLAIPALWLVDSVLLLSITWMVIGILVPGRALLKVQGIASLIIGVLLLITGVTQWSLLLARLYAFFLLLFSHRKADFATLAISSTLKIAFAVLLVLAYQRFLGVRSMVLLVATSIGLNVLAAILWNLWPPLPIMDTVAAFVNISFGIGWCVFMMMASVRSVVRLWPTRL